MEQQFYLIWPWVILLVPKRYLLLTIILFISIGIFSQHMLPANGFSLLFTSTCFDTLGLGALVAWLLEFKPQVISKVYKVVTPLTLISILLIFGQALFGNFFFLYNRTLIAVVTAWTIAHFILKETSTKRKRAFFFNSEGLRLIGKISYGVYLYHITLSYHSYSVFIRLNQFLPFPAWFNNSILLMMEELLLVFGMAWLSWKFFELPISKLKVYFTTNYINNRKPEIVLSAKG